MINPKVKNSIFQCFQFYTLIILNQPGYKSYELYVSIYFSFIYMNYSR